MTTKPYALCAGLLALCLLGPIWPADAARTFSPLDHRMSRGSLFEWSPLIQQIQDLLIEFDLFAGPANGRMTPETQRAIRAYQKQSGAPVTGDADEGLLRHMETVGRAATLKNRLAKARDEQVEKARSALQGSAATRDLLQGERPVLASLPPQNFDDCLRAPDIQCLLDGAIRSIGDIKREDYRDWALRDLIQAQASAGQVNAARESIKRLSDLRLILVALREAAAALAEAGFSRDAHELTETIPDPWNKARALLAVALADRTPQEASDHLLTLLPQLEDRAGALEIAAELLAEIAERGLETDSVFDMTETLLGEFRDRSRTALGAVAAAYARADRTEETIRVLDRIGHTGRESIALAETAGMLARRGAQKSALQTADRLRTPQLYVLAVTKIATATLDRNKPFDAAAALRKAEAAALDIERPFAADTAWAQIAKVWSDLADTEKTLLSINRIKSRALAAQTLWEFAAKSDQTGALFQTRAIAATDKIESAFDRAATLARAARGLAESGLKDRAQQTFERAVLETKAIKNSWWRARILSLLARVLTTF